MTKLNSLFRNFANASKRKGFMSDHVRSYVRLSVMQYQRLNSVSDCHEILCRTSLPKVVEHAGASWAPAVMLHCRSQMTGTVAFLIYWPFWATYSAEHLHRTPCVLVCFIPVGTVSATLYQQANWISVRTATLELRVLCSSVDLHLAVLSVCTVCAGRARKCHTFLMGLNEGAVALVPWERMTFWA